MTQDPETLMRIDRRGFLQSVALAGGGFMLGWRPAAQGAAPNTPFSPNPWVRLEPTGVLTILVDKSEMGQGVMTALPMLLAEELDADWSSIRIEFAPVGPQFAHPWFHTQATGGSSSVRAMWLPLRQAGAGMRWLLRQAAATRWNVALEDVHVHQGELSAGLRRATFGGMADAAARIPVPTRVTLKDPKDFTLLGKSVPRVDARVKSTGAARFGLDMRMPGLLTAVVARPPVLGAPRLHFEASDALKIPGVRFVVPLDAPSYQGVAVLADTTWQALQGRRALSIQWGEPPVAADSARFRTEMKSRAASGAGAIVAVSRGEEASVPGGRTVESLYEVPYLAHATMEPLNCTAWVQAQGAQCWVGTQAQGPNQQLVAHLTGLPLENIAIHTQYLGGGFGRRFAPDFVADAVLLSKALQLPVKVVLTREDDLQATYYRPMAICALRAHLDAEGRVTDWHATTVTDSIARGTGFEAALMQGDVDRSAVEGLADIPYALPRFKTQWIPFEAGVRVWFWRSVGHSQNSFFSESFVDELAHAAGQDPYTFRRNLLQSSPRHQAVLDLVAHKAQWGTALPAGHARGIALVESFGSIVAQVAEVSIVENRPRVHHVTIAADVGRVVHPDIVVAQLEGGMVFGLTAALHGQITLEGGRVSQSNFHDYPLLRMNEMPVVEVVLADSSADPGGVGEPGTPPIAPAVCNALFALTGRRVYRLPLSEQDFSGV